MRAAIVGVAGLRLEPGEEALLRRCPPAGVILFGRNILDPDQLASLVAQLRAVLPPDAVLMVDQEGGRVARLKPPIWRAHPSARQIGQVYQACPQDGLRLAWLTGALIGVQCRQAGFDVSCAPVLDRSVPGAHDVIGDRAYSPQVHVISALARQVADGLLAAGVQPVGKHAPGHGRAGCDSHLDLPRVAGVPDEDLEPFQALRDLPWMMTAHIVFEEWDQRPATLSQRVIRDVIRGRIGVEGVLISDDLAMKALSGAPEDLAREALAAGCDIALYCAGDLMSTQNVLQACPMLQGTALARLRAARGMAEDRIQTLDEAALAVERESLLA